FDVQGRPGQLGLGAPAVGCADDTRSRLAPMSGSGDVDDPEEPTGPDGEARPRIARRLLAPLLLGSALNPLNSTVISVALAPIAMHFGATAADVAWLVTGLYLATAV